MRLRCGGCWGGGGECSLEGRDPAGLLPRLSGGRTRRTSGGHFEPRTSCNSEASRLALAAAASARDGCWLGDAGAASWVAGGRASSARAGGGWVQILVSNLESQGTVLLTILSPVHHCLPSHRRTQGWRASSRQVSRPWSAPRPTTLLKA